ncbi:MAG: PH domain-containing protein [Bacilli bacterium]|nr:PH domain-containing protein [Bacilli bacterium]
MSRVKDRAMTDIEKMDLRLMPEEEVLYVARPGKRMDLFFLIVFLAIVGFCIALYFLGAWGLRVNNPAGGGSSISVASVGVIAAVAVVIYRFIVMGHAFVLTNHRVIVLKGGKFRSRKFLNLDEIGGAEIDQGFLYRLFGLATIDFFSPSSQPKVKTFLIISFSSTSFKFIYLARKDGEAIYNLLTEELEKLPKRKK